MRVWAPSRLSGVWRRLRSLWPGALRQQVTRTGMVYAIATVMIASAAFLSANNLLFLVSAAMIAVLGVSGFVSKLGLAGLEIDVLLPEHISARRNIRGRVRLKNLKRWVSSFSIQLRGAPGSGVESAIYFPVVAGGTTADEPLDLFFPTRGRHGERTFELHTRFPFGFAERRESVTMRHEVIVYPCLDPQPGFEELLASVSGELESQQRGRGYDFYRIRPYEATESARHVDWKATAHTGSLQVREFARDEDQRVMIYLDLDCPESEGSWFETAVDCAAFLAYRLNLRGARVRLRTAEFDIGLPQDGDIHTILKYLALVSPRAGATPEGPDDSGCVKIVFTRDPARLVRNGWAETEHVRLLGPDAFPRTHSG
jgi:uncharacterized protein (DUF58 family)